MLRVVEELRPERCLVGGREVPAPEDDHVEHPGHGHPGQTLEAAGGTGPVSLLAGVCGWLIPGAQAPDWGREGEDEVAKTVIVYSQPG